MNEPIDFVKDDITRKIYYKTSNSNTIKILIGLVFVR